MDLLNREDAVKLIMDRALTSDASPLGVASANLDHIHHFGIGGPWHRMFESGAASSEGMAVQEAELGEWLLLLDGAPLVNRAKAITGRAWPRLAGSDLIGEILTRAESASLTVGFLGGRDEMHKELARVLAAKWPRLSTAGMWAPSRSQITKDDEARILATEVKTAGVQILFVGLGKPRQELWIARNGTSCGARVLLAFGAAPDFIAGVVPRAPEWMSLNGAEWVWRLIKEPRRLARRYLIQGPASYLALRLSSSGSDEIVTRQWRLRPPPGHYSELSHRFTKPTGEALGHDI